MINYADQNTLVIDSNACALLRSQKPESIAFLFHEYLGLALIEDTGFLLSTEFSREVAKVKSVPGVEKTFEVIPYTSVGKYALAWGVLAKQIDFSRCLTDLDYRDWMLEQPRVTYLIDQTLQ